MRILVDWDDVLTNTDEVWVKALNLIYGKNYTIEDVKDWDMKTMYPDIPKSELVKPLNTEIFWTQVRPLPGAVEYLQKLIDDGNEIYICTATDFCNIQWKIKYILNKYFPFFPTKNIIVCRKKQLINADILIDDNPKNLLDGNYYGLLFSSSHNLSFDETNFQNLTRVSDWEDCYNTIYTLYQSQSQETS